MSDKVVSDIGYEQSPVYYIAGLALLSMAFIIAAYPPPVFATDEARVISAIVIGVVGWMGIVKAYVIDANRVEILTQPNEIDVHSMDNFFFEVEPYSLGVLSGESDLNDIKIVDSPEDGIKVISTDRYYAGRLVGYLSADSSAKFRALIKAEGYRFAPAHQVARLDACQDHPLRYVIEALPTKVVNKLEEPFLLSLNTKAKGCSKYQIPFQNLKKGQEVILIPEPDNPHDANAIRLAVDIDGHKQTIGYVARLIAEALSNRLRSGEKIEAKVRSKGKSQYSKLWGATIEFYKIGSYVDIELDYTQLNGERFNVKTQSVS